MNMTKTRKNTRDDKNSNIKSAEEISLFEKSKYGLDLVNGWISSADSKIGTFGAVYAVVVAVFVYIADKFFATVDCTNVINPILLQWSKYSAIAAIVSVLITIFFNIKPQLVIAKTYVTFSFPVYPWNNITHMGASLIPFDN